MKINTLKNKKGITGQTIFYILMSIMLITILIFGFQNIFKVSNEMSEIEKVEMQKKLEQKLKICDEGLNSGTKAKIILKNQKFNTICFLSNDYNLPNSPIKNSLNNYDEIISIGDTGDNVILIKSEIFENTILENEIVSSFKTQTQISQSFCSFPKQNTNDFEFELICD